jgi:hypothetical protein
MKNKRSGWWPPELGGYIPEVSEEDILTESDKQFIKQYISSSKEWDQYTQLHSIYKKLLTYGVRVETPNWYLCFLSEEFNACPDYSFKSLCRKKILEGIPRKSESFITRLLKIFK